MLFSGYGRNTFDKREILESVVRELDVGSIDKKEYVTTWHWGKLYRRNESMIFLVATGESFTVKNELICRCQCQ